jgi:hypothetical protein
VSKAVDLAALIADRVTMRVEKEGKIMSEIPSAAVLNTCLRSEVFLSQFPSVDRISRGSIYSKEFELLEPGYHDLGPGNRILIIGQHPEISDSTETLIRFLKVMEFESEADRTNAVAGAITVLLRDHWPGGKPIVVITATRITPASK